MPLHFKGSLEAVFTHKHTTETFRQYSIVTQTERNII